MPITPESTRCSLSQRWWPWLYAALLLTVVPWVHARAQVQVNFAGGEVGNYQRALLVYFQQSHDLVAEIEAITISTTYCPQRARTDARQPLIVARRHYDALRIAYANFKVDIERSWNVSSTLDQFRAANGGELPAKGTFWKNADAEILGHPRADLEAKEKRWAASKVKCDTPRRTATAVQPARPPARPSTNPLSGLTRPAVPAHAAVPALPPPFCSYRELWAWHDANLRPQMQKYLDAGWELMLYSQRIADALEKQRDAGDTVAIAQVRQELDWVDRTHRANDANYYELARIRDRLTVISCGMPRTPDTTRTSRWPDSTRVRPTPDTTRAIPLGKQTGFNWRVGAGIEYAGYPDFKKVVGTQYASSGISAKGGTTGVGISIGLDTRRWGCGLSAHFNALEYEQTYNPTEINFARRTMGTLDGQFYDASCGPRWHFGDIRVGALAGGTFARNNLEIVDAFVNGNTVTTLRQLQNWKTNFGGFVETPITDRFGFRLDLTHTLGGWSKDADRNLRVGAGLQFRPGGFHQF